MWYQCASFFLVLGAFALDQLCGGLSSRFCCVIARSIVRLEGGSRWCGVPSGCTAALSIHRFVLIVRKSSRDDIFVRDTNIPTFSNFSHGFLFLIFNDNDSKNK